MRTSPLFAVLTAAVLFSACQSKQIDNSMVVDPGTGISYSTEVQPIFNQSCGGVGCHVGDAVNGVDLSGYAQTLASMGAQYGGPIVLPGNGAGSPLVDKLTPNPRHGSRMPLGAAPLSAASIATIRAWIDEGAENN